MLGPTRKPPSTSIQDKLQQCLHLLFSKSFSPSLFFPLLLQLCQDPDLHAPSTLLFSLYNLLIQDHPEIGYKGLSKLQTENPNSVANIAGLVVRSAYEAYGKRYKEAIDLLLMAMEVCESGNGNGGGGLDREFVGFYGQVVGRMVEIYQFGAFRKEYLGIIDKILSTYDADVENNEILKQLAKHRENLKIKTCTLTKNPIEFSSIRPGSTRLSKFSFGKKQSQQANNPNSSQNSQNHSKDRQKSSDSSKLSNYYSPRAHVKLNSNSNFRASSKKFVNPYGLGIGNENGNQGEANKCVFM